MEYFYKILDTMSVKVVYNCRKIIGVVVLRDVFYQKLYFCTACLDLPFTNFREKIASKIYTKKQGTDV